MAGWVKSNVPLEKKKKMEEKEQRLETRRSNRCLQLSENQSGGGSRSGQRSQAMRGSLTCIEHD